ncbi:MAG: hypothetical protein JW842_12780, partial [Prolixibacteraceae bacterium]|nr:hypothetical protein [Prolixibacteraceae bacterium]
MKKVILLLALCLLFNFINENLNAQPFIDATGKVAPISENGVFYASLKLTDADLDGAYDAAFALSETAITDWPDYSCVVAFYSTITTRNGNTMVPSTITVDVGKWYDIWIDVNVTTKTYDVYYKTSEMVSHVLVASNQAFRKNSISSINRWSCMHNIQGEPDFLSAKSVGMVSAVGDYPNSANISEPDLALVSASVDFSVVTSIYDRKKVLNVARGGHGINTDLRWMPSFYDNLVEIGIDEFRVDWVLADWFYKVVSRDDLGQLKYDFSKLDRVILPMVNKG